MDFNKLATSKRQANLSLKARAYVDDSGTKPPKRKSIGNNAKDVEGDDAPEHGPKKGRLAQNNGAGPTPASKDSNPHASTASRSSSQGDGAARVGLSSGASNPRIPSASRSTAPRASLGSVGDVTSSAEPSVEDEALIVSDVEMEEVEVQDKNPAGKKLKESDEEQLGM